MTGAAGGLAGSFTHYLFGASMVAAYGTLLEMTAFTHDGWGFHSARVGKAARWR
jgi:hypothetical protein